MKHMACKARSLGRIVHALADVAATFTLDQASLQFKADFPDPL
jgi:polyisoprenoid-binding protein YceI